MYIVQQRGCEKIFLDGRCIMQTFEKISFVAK